MASVGMRSLVYSRDTALISTLNRVLEAVQIEAVTAENDESAYRHMSKGGFDGLIFDWQASSNPEEVIRQFQEAVGTGKTSHITAVVDSSESFKPAYKSAPLVIYKPATYEQGARMLRPLLNLMVKKRRQDYRFSVDIAAELQLGFKRASGRVIDLSERGARIESDLALCAGDQISVALPLFGTRKKALCVQANVVWTVPSKSVGVSFNFTGAQQRVDLANWLSVNGNTVMPLSRTQNAELQAAAGSN